MWRNWNPFRRKTKEDEDKREDLGQTQGGKENNVSNRAAEMKINGNNSFLATESSINNDNESDYLRRKAVSRQESLRSRTRMGLKDQLNTSLPNPYSRSNRPVTRCPDDNPMNKTFSGVHGPLLSSSIVPQIKKAFESQAGIG